jgi:hypothetical protein
MKTDLVVVIPGILGSTLAKDGKLVWAPSGGAALRAIATFGRSLRDLQLPAGIGDDHPGDGVAPVALMPDLHVLPGIWTPLKGYDAVVKRLERNGFSQTAKDPDAPPGNLVLFPYDWRLSNRYNGNRLKSVVEPALDRWRAQGGVHADAKICFVCHSMGGLVARWFMKEGGADLTRKLITLGTPYRGAANSLDQLAHGAVRAGLNLTDFARSLPSSYQLLPSYACVDRNEALVTLGELDNIPGLDIQRVRDAMLFAKELEDAESDFALDDVRHALTGIEQTTLTTARITAESVTMLESYQGKILAGDGTVPAVSAPKGIRLDSPLLGRIGEKHGSLQANDAVLDAVIGAINAVPLTPMAAGEGPVPDVVLADVVDAGQDLTVTVSLESDEAIKVSLFSEANLDGELDLRVPRKSGSEFRTTFADLAPGAYIVRVTTASGSTVDTPTLVWSDVPLQEV